MNLKSSIMTKNPCYQERNITVKGLMLHSVGCAQPSAEVFIRKWNNASYDRACVHAFIDANTGDVYQTLPWNKRGWHCGDSGNNTHIGVEMCESSYITYTSGTSFKVTNRTKAKADARRAYKAAVELFAMLCKKYNLDPTKKGVIVSHREGYALGIASNHGDPEHYWNGLGLSYTMNGFRNAVAKQMIAAAPVTEKKTETTVKAKKKTTTKKADTSAAQEYSASIKGTYQIIARDGLNLREGAGTSYKIILAMHAGDTVKCYGYHTGAWYYVQYITGKNTYEGFCSKTYLRKK